MPSPLRLGLVGAGNQGREHMVDAASVQIVAVADPMERSRAAFQRDHPAVRTHPDVASMVAAENLDGIIIAVPHHIVPRVWPEVLAARVPVLKEKPLGRTLPEALSLIAAAEAAGVPVVTAIQRRTHPSYVRLAEILREEALTVSSAAATLHLGFDPCASTGTWRDDRAEAGGGALLDSGYHLVDLIQMLVGALEVVSATFWTPAGPAGPAEIDTDAIVHARAGRTWVRIESRVGGTKHESIVLDTDGGRLRADRTGVWRDGEPVFRCERGWAAGMIAQLDRFASMVERRAFDAAVVWDQVAAMRVIEQSYSALDRVGDARLGGRP